MKDAIFGSFLDVDPNQEISLRTLVRVLVCFHTCFTKCISCARVNMLYTPTRTCVVCICRCLMKCTPCTRVMLQIDHSIVESFGGEGKSCITARVYPKLAILKNAHIYVFNNGTKSVTITRLRGWSMKKA